MKISHNQLYAGYWQQFTSISLLFPKELDKIDFKMYVDY